MLKQRLVGQLMSDDIMMVPGTAFDNGWCDGGQLPLEMFPEVIVELVVRHLVVEHEVDGGRDVREEGLLQGRRVRQGRVLGDLKQYNALISRPLSETAPHGKIMPI